MAAKVHPAEVSGNDAVTVPRDYASLRELIIARRDELPKRLVQVAAFALESPDDIAFGTAASIAEQCGVQPSTLVRFSQALGYQGFTDLQLVFRDRLKERAPTYRERLVSLKQHSRPAAQTVALIDGFAAAAQRSVDAMRDRLDLEALEQAVDRLATARMIYLIGLRRSYPAIAYLAYAFSKLGVAATQLGSPSGIDAEILSFSQPEDALLAISFSPYAAGTVALARDAQARGTPVVAITDSPFSPLVEFASPWLEVVEADFEGFRSPAATFALAMSLAVAVAERRAG